jgi:hypothetical protein
MPVGTTEIWVERERRRRRAGGWGEREDGCSGGREWSDEKEQWRQWRREEEQGNSWQRQLILGQDGGTERGNDGAGRGREEATMILRVGFLRWGEWEVGRLGRSTGYKG